MSDWYYLRLHLATDPRLGQEQSELYNSIDIDLLTWHSIICRALSDWHGIAGEARHFDILVKQRRTPALDTIVRIQKPDLDIFLTSLSNFTFGLSEYLGNNYHFGAYIQVIDYVQSLGLLADQSLVVS